jgi:hypothetical protein
LLLVASWVAAAITIATKQTNKQTNKKQARFPKACKTPKLLQLNWKTLE